MKCSVSGSFRFYETAILPAIDAFLANGIEVLSPRRSRIRNPGEPFLLLETDPSGVSPTDKRAIDLIEARHIIAIGRSDFMYVANLEGRIGRSAEMEMEHASRLGVPVFVQTPPEDPVIRRYVAGIFSPEDLAAYLKDSQREPP